LGERAIRITFVRSEFDEQVWPERLDYPEGKWNMTVPTDDVGEAVRHLEHDGSTNALGEALLARIVSIEQVLFGDFNRQSR
jgi:hypothetical protein